MNDNKISKNKDNVKSCANCLHVPVCEIRIDYETKFIESNKDLINFAMLKHVRIFLAKECHYYDLKKEK